jgi:DNA-3-methyladenine glycosylase II
MNSASEAIVPVHEPYRLDRTVAVLRRFSTNIVDRTTPDGRYVRALEGFAGPVVLCVVQSAPGALTVALSGAAGEEARALALTRRMLGTERDLSAFHRRAGKVPWLRPLAARMRGVKPPRYPTLWEACANAIVFQQISLSAASAIMHRTVAALGVRTKFEGLELHAFPGSERIAACDEAGLRGFGLSANKVATLRRVAEALSGGALDEVMLESRSSAEAAELLCRIKGIGPWTAAVILLRGVGRLDVFPMNDSGIARSARAFNDPAVDVDAALHALGDERGMLYYLFLLARLEARGELAAAPALSRQPSQEMRRAKRGTSQADRT